MFYPIPLHGLVVSTRINFMLLRCFCPSGIPQHGNLFQQNEDTHRIHGAGKYASIGGILMVNVTIYSIHGSYGI